MIQPLPRVTTTPVRALQVPGPAQATREDVAPSEQVSLGVSSASPQLQWKPGPSLVHPRAQELARGLEKSWQGTAASSVAELAARYFSASEFQALSSGSYHNFEHPLVVAEATGAFAHGLGWSPERKEFMQQVALLHDADDRSTVEGEVKAGMPARAQVTLEWMDQHRDELCQRFGWDEPQLSEAKALIARTDFPFNDKPKSPMGTRYDGQSPVQVYRQLLEKLPPEVQSRVLRDGLALRFADQAGFYAQDFDLAVESVQGLASELQSVGVPTTLAGALKFTPSFLADVGKDCQFDRQLSQEFGLSQDLPDREQLLELWHPAHVQRFHSNTAQFQLLGQALDSVAAEETEARLADLKQVARSTYRMTTGLPPT